MKIKRIRAYRADLPLHEGSYQWSGGSYSNYEQFIRDVQSIVLLRVNLFSYSASSARTRPEDQSRPYRDREKER